MRCTCPLLAQSGHALLHCMSRLLTQSGHGAVLVERRVEIDQKPTDVALVGIFKIMRGLRMRCLGYTLSMIP
jgi:hypothetical protein